METVLIPVHIWGVIFDLIPKKALFQLELVNTSFQKNVRKYWETILQREKIPTIPNGSFSCKVKLISVKLKFMVASYSHFYYIPLSETYICSNFSRGQVPLYDILPPEYNKRILLIGDPKCGRTSLTASLHRTSLFGEENCISYEESMTEKPRKEWSFRCVRDSNFVAYDELG
jgi:hypothetical protein